MGLSSTTSPTRRNASSGEFTELRRQGVRLERHRFHTGLGQALDMLLSVWRERRCRHVWSDERQEPTGCLLCGKAMRCEPDQ